MLGPLLLALVLPLTLTLAFGSQPASAATPSPAPSPTSTATPSPAPIRSPSISSPSSGALLGGSLTISGSAEPGSGIQVSSSTQSDPLCVGSASSGGGWSCQAPPLPSAPGVTLRVVQLADGYANRSDSVTVDVLNAPTMTSGSGKALTTGFGTVRGTAYPGAKVTATAGSHFCSYLADPQGGWSCNLGSDIPSGTLAARATQSTSWSGGPSAPSAVLTLQVDSDAPATPSILSPTAGTTVKATGATFSGTGEKGALVTVFAGSFAACTATVRNASWSCSSTAVPPGSAAVSALQQDVAGNVGPESVGFTVTFAAATASPAPSGSAAAGAPSAPATGDSPPSPGPGVAGAPPVEPSPGDGAGAPGTGDGTPGDGGSNGPGSGGQASHSAGGQARGAWAAPTPFSTAVRPAFGAGSTADWWLALALALAVIALIAAPARLVVGTIARARNQPSPDSLSPPRALPMPRTRLGITGRNRPRDEFDTAPELRLNPWLIATAAVLASSAIGMLSGPVDSQPAYLRLLAALCIAGVVVNVVQLLVPALIGHRMLGIRSRVRDSAVFAPQYLLITAAATLLSRVLSLEPALVFGLVVTLGAAGTLTRAARGKRALIHIATLLVMGSLAWAVVSVLHPDHAAPVSTAGGTFVAELLNAIVLGSFGAAAVMALPFGTLSGRALLAWSKPAWSATAVVSVTLLGVVLSTDVDRVTRFAPAAAVVVGVVAFAAVSLSVWAWLRFIAPALK